MENWIRETSWIKRLLFIVFNVIALNHFIDYSRAQSSRKMKVLLEEKLCTSSIEGTNSNCHPNFTIILWILWHFPSWISWYNPNLWLFSLSRDFAHFFFLPALELKFLFNKFEWRNFFSQLITQQMDFTVT
jgi:hypothetical protein